MSSAFNRLLLAVAMLHSTHGFSIRAVNKLPPRPAVMNQARLRGGLGPEARVVDMHVAAAAMFGNIRTPAALVAGACLPLGYAFAFPGKDDTPMLRALKRINVAIAFLAVNSELLSVVFSTNAINRLHFHAGTSQVMAGSVMELLTSKTFYKYWVGVYVHFIIGVIGLVCLTGIRTWLAVGPNFGLPVLLMMGASLTHILAAVNRGVVVSEPPYPSANFAHLCQKYFAITWANATSRVRVCDLLSIVLVIAATVIAVRRWKMIDDWTENFAGKKGKGGTDLGNIR